VTITVARAGYTDASSVATGVALNAGTVPTFDVPVSTPDGSP